MAKGTLALRQIQLGDNADTSKNFVVSVPAVADGTLVIERGNGADVLSIAADGKVTVPQGIVESRTWQNVAGSRAMSTTYTNNTGRTIQAAVTLVGKAENLYFQLNGVDVVANYSPSPSVLMSFVVDVPPGSTYGVRYETAGGSINRWWELR